MPHRLRKLNAIVVAALATAGVAAAASDAPQCHPDLPGTRTLSVTGTVTSYRFAAPGTLAVSVRGGVVVRWNDAANASASGRGSRAAGPATAPQKLFAVQGDRLVRVVLAANGVDRPDRLDVFARATGHRIASWPLIARPARVALSGGIAILSGADRGALYALRISDGRIAQFFAVLFQRESNARHTVRVLRILARCKSGHRRGNRFGVLMDRGAGGIERRQRQFQLGLGAGRVFDAEAAGHAVAVVDRQRQIVGD